MRVLRFALPVALLPACIIPIGGAEVGDVRVTWSFEGSQRCADVGVEQVSIQLIKKGAEGVDKANAFGLAADCIAGSLEIPDVDAGDYVLTANGVGDVAIFNNDDGEEVTVVPGGLNDFSAPMKLANGDVVSRVEFRTSFAGEALCSTAGVATINAQVIDDAGDGPIAIAGVNVPCVDGIVGIDGVKSKGEHRLEIEGLDADGNVRFKGDTDLRNLEPGATKFIGTVDLAPATADVTVRFAFDGVIFCAVAGVDNIDAQLIDQEGRIEQGQNIDCILGNIVFADVPVGIYDLHVDAVDGDGAVQYATDQRDIEVGTVDVDLGVVDLAALASTVRVRFRLPDDLTCAQAGIETVDIQIIDEDGGVTGTNVPCINGDSGDLIGPRPGAVDIRVQGLSDGIVSFDGGEEAVQIGSGANFLEVELVAVTTTLELSWSFATVNVNNVVETPTPIAALSTRCVDADVDTVNIRILQGRRLITAVAADCDAGRVDIPGVPIGDVDVEIEGSRDDEGDSIFFGRDDDDGDDVPGIGDNADVIGGVTVCSADSDCSVTAGQRCGDDNLCTGGGARTSANIVLSPSLVFLRAVWSGDCGVTGSASVDINVLANNLSTGLNVPCANGNVLIALPPGSEDAPVTVALTGVDGQGVPRRDLNNANDPGDDVTLTEVVRDFGVVPGINTVRLDGPL
jgi:hypothetical protein